MSLIARVRNRLPYRLYPNPVTGPVLVKSTGSMYRHFGQPARKEDEEEEEEVEIDQRRLPAHYDPANFDPTVHCSPPTERVWRLVDDISSLTLVEASDLSSVMMRKLGMKEIPVVGVMKPGTTAAAAGTTTAAKEDEKKPEKTAFELKDLKEAKDLVEKVPAILKMGVAKEEAEKIIDDMKTVGAKVVMG